MERKNRKQEKKKSLQKEVGRTKSKESKKGANERHSTL